ncbi:MAG: hypothetical protein NWE89_03155 [Candidatus Bathyarchaeota archaeon]|nr:hypothetical protein [Candidatus Bathyarchaeota archaeon]
MGEIVLYVAIGGFVTSLILGIKAADRSKSGYKTGYLHGHAEAKSTAMFELIMLVAIALGLPRLMGDATNFSMYVGVAFWFVVNWLIILGMIKPHSRKL